MPDDNTFSESQFKTMKYRPDFPNRCGSLEDGLAFARPFFAGTQQRTPPQRARIPHTGIPERCHSETPHSPCSCVQRFARRTAVQPTFPVLVARAILRHCRSRPLLTRGRCCAGDLFCLIPQWPLHRILDLAPLNWKKTAALPDVQELLDANLYGRLTLAHN